MASIRKNGKRWRAEVHANGQRASKSFATKAEATHWTVDVERKMQAGSFSNRTVNDAFERYAEEISPTKHGEQWERTRLLFYGRDPFGLIMLRDLDVTHTAELRDRRLKQVSGGTWLRDVALLSNVMRYAVREWKWLRANPFSDTATPEDNPARDRRIAEWEIEELRRISSANPETLSARVFLAFEFAIETGMRGGEICAMQRENVHVDYVHIPAILPGERKSKKRDVPLSPKAINIIKQVMALELGPTVWGMTQSQKDANFRKLVAQAGIENLNFHDTRHEATTRLSKKIPVLALARMLGHNDIRQLMTYYNESASDIAAML